MTKSIEQLFSQTAASAGLPLSNSEVQQLMRQLDARGDAAGSFEALTRNPGSPGGRAYLLRDLFSLWDAALLLTKVGVSTATHGNILLPLLWESIGLMRRFRKIAVELSPIEFDVMLAVKSGADSEQQIAGQISKTQPEVADAVRTLMTKEYARGKTLLHRDAATDGIVTEF